MRYRLFVVLFLSVCCGCPGGKFKLHPVEGTVTQDGKPLMNAQIEFHPQTEGGTSYGVTDENGHFTLGYAGGKKGAIAGKHLVRIIGGTTDLKEAQEEMELRKKVDAAGQDGPPVPMPRPKPSNNQSKEPVYCEALSKGKTVLETKL
ncbi:MAG: carboxypeptidase-like regulatory domain-containing protein [Planctomycetaceae bacterium]|nr:carboxypeptidase-like regulatory domain-containing protein [Planctomycetaceae bacterium]